jgi:hypothetical protein
MHKVQTPLRCEKERQKLAPAEVLERLLDGELAVESQLLRHVAHIGTRHQRLPRKKTKQLEKMLMILKYNKVIYFIILS